ncbi:MAG: BatA domain-containing protein, partial [Gemmatimonadales bacterium]|nr:BatA domain-containing protein [Gemmatimonadales bacterium]
MIGFATPWFLLALPAAALPILLHLVRRHEPPEVAFPAVQYLADATRDHRRRAELRHLLLLITRTLLILAIVLAAAGMRLTRGAFGSHAPSALVLVVDNSASSGVVVDGEPLLTALRAAAAAVLDRATPTDRLWLRTATGPAIPGSPAQLRERLAALRPTASRLDLGAAV